MIRGGVDIAGQQFGRLTALEPVWDNKRTRWKCRCECGVVKLYDTGNLRSGSTTSCGCYRKEVSVKTMRTYRQAPKHGNARRGPKPRSYTTWCGMKARCTNPNNVSYHRYGGRGVTVCERWMNSYVAFLEDLGEPESHQTLDRIDPDGHYEPGNVRWATSVQQARNKSDFHCECCPNYQATEPGSTG